MVHFQNYWSHTAVAIAVLYLISKPTFIMFIDTYLAFWTTDLDAI